MNEKIHTQPYKPNPNACCEACCFNSGDHAEWCRESQSISGPAVRAAIVSYADIDTVNIPVVLALESLLSEGLTTVEQYCDWSDTQ